MSVLVHDAIKLFTFAIAIVAHGVTYVDRSNLAQWVTVTRANLSWSFAPTYRWAKEKLLLRSIIVETFYISVYTY